MRVVQCVVQPQLLFDQTLVWTCSGDPTLRLSDLGQEYVASAEAWANAEKEKTGLLPPKPADREGVSSAALLLVSGVLVISDYFGTQIDAAPRLTSQMRQVSGLIG